MRKVYFETKLRTMLRAVSTFALAAVALLTVACGPKNHPLAAGDVAPEFALVGSDGKTHRLSDFRGKFVVLAWFPKAFTGG